MFLAKAFGIYDNIDLGAKELFTLYGGFCDFASAMVGRVYGIEQCGKALISIFQQLSARIKIEGGGGRGRGGLIKADELEIFPQKLSGRRAFAGPKSITQYLKLQFVLEIR